MNIRWIILLLLTLTFNACRSAKPSVNSVEVEKLMPYKVGGDSATLLLEIDCGEVKPIIRHISSTTSENIEISSVLKHNILSLQANTKPQTVWLPYKTLTQTKTIEVYRLHAWQKVLMFIGALALIYLLIKIIINIKKIST